MTTKRKSPEADQQKALVAWCKLNKILLISIPNGAKRSWALGKHEVDMGLTKGVSDLFMPLVNKKYAGFWIEMKAPGEKPTELQFTWLKMMREQGYMSAWFDNWEKAKEKIEQYLKNEL